MSDRHLTLLELHLHDTELQVGSRVLGGDDADSSAGSEDETGESAEPTDTGATGLGLVALVLVLLAVGVAVKRLLDEEDLGSLEDLDVEDEEL